MDIPASTASFLDPHTTLSIAHKGEILAAAYAVNAIRNADNAEYNQHGDYKYYLTNAAGSIKILQGLRRAVQRLKNA